MSDDTVFSYEDFEPRVGQVFYLRGEPEDAPLTLVEAKRLPTSLREGGSFALLFESEADLQIPQASYTLHTEGMELIIFLVPIGPHGEGYGYESVYN